MVTENLDSLNEETLCTSKIFIQGNEIKILSEQISGNTYIKIRMPFERGKRNHSTKFKSLSTDIFVLYVLLVVRKYCRWHLQWDQLPTIEISGPESATRRYELRKRYLSIFRECNVTSTVVTAVFSTEPINLDRWSSQEVDTTEQKWRN